MAGHASPEPNQLPEERTPDLPDVTEACWAFSRQVSRQHLFSMIEDYCRSTTPDNKESARFNRCVVVKAHLGYVPGFLTWTWTSRRLFKTLLLAAGNIAHSSTSTF